MSDPRLLLERLEQPGALAFFDVLPRIGSMLELVDGDRREVVQVFSAHKKTRICGLRRGVGTDSYDWPEGTQVL